LPYPRETAWTAPWKTAARRAGGSLPTRSKP